MMPNRSTGIIAWSVLVSLGVYGNFDGRAALLGAAVKGEVSAESRAIRDTLADIPSHPPAADLVIKNAKVVTIDRDLLTVPHDQIMSAKVDYTIVGGKTVYRRNRPAGGATAKDRPQSIRRLKGD